MDEGKLVPMNLVVNLVTDRPKDDCKGGISPRWLPKNHLPAEQLDKFLSENGSPKLDIVL